MEKKMEELKKRTKWKTLMFCSLIDMLLITVLLYLIIVVITNPIMRGFLAGPVVFIIISTPLFGYDILYEKIFQRNIKKTFSNVPIQQIANEYLYTDLKQAYRPSSYGTKSLQTLQRTIRSRNVELEKKIVSSIQGQDYQSVYCKICSSHISIKKGSVTSTCDCASTHAIRRHVNG